jgi:hypothetical protein
MPSSAHSFGSNSNKSLFANDFRSLGIKDLLDARDQFHVHLAHKANVFSTATGLYLVRTPESGAASRDVVSGNRKSNASARTLLNSEVKDWSWPCILVFVTKWQTLEDLRSKPEEVIPPFVYMPDGRIIPICVVLVETSALPAREVAPSSLVTNTLSVGSPIYVDAQGMRRMGTVACMVSDGSDFYLLTNTHLAGQSGRPVRALINGVPQLVGTTLGTRNLTEKTFSDVYPKLPGRDSVVNIDAAIVRMEDATAWQTNALAKPLGAVADFSAETASLAWIGRPVVGQGAASGAMEGEIKALFYRYKSIGGRDYVADFVIGSRSSDKNKLLITQPGDSGSLWCLDSVLENSTLSPTALEWGGQRILSGPSKGQFLQLSLATSLAVILRELSLDVVQDPAAERTQYWGPVGHFKIGQQACFLVKDKGLKNFFQANINNLSFSSDAQLKTATHLQAKDFVPLSDVPDVVWKTNINRVKPSVARPQENWNHYADIDLPGADGKTLLEKYLADPKSLEYSVWMEFYEGKPRPTAATSKTVAYGALPFRVWQIFSKLVGYATTDGASFLTAAGCLAHYVGDSCQPLHSSQHSDGLNGASTGVHSTYEDNMVNAYADQIAAGIGDAIANVKFTPRKISSPRDAAMAVMDLMNFCHGALPPETICNVYNKARPGSSKSATKNADVLKALWDNCGEATIEVIAAGAVTLGAIWQAAWTLSGAGAPDWLGKVYDGSSDLMPIYEGTDFLRSLHLEYLGQSDLPGTDAPVNPPAPPAAKKTGTKTAAKKGSKQAAKKTPAKIAAKRVAKKAKKVATKTTAKKATKKNS